MGAVQTVASAQGLVPVLAPALLTTLGTTMEEEVPVPRAAVEEVVVAAAGVPLVAVGPVVARVPAVAPPLPGATGGQMKGGPTHLQAVKAAAAEGEVVVTEAMAPGPEVAPAPALPPPPVRGTGLEVPVPTGAAEVVGVVAVVVSGGRARARDPAPAPAPALALHRAVEDILECKDRLEAFSVSSSPVIVNVISTVRTCS